MGSGKILILVALLIAGGISLYFFSEDSTKTQELQKQVYTDSLPAPEQPTITAQEDTHDTVAPPPPVGEDFAPGTALVRATILSVEYAGDQPAAVEVQVDEVMGYGPSTPPLPVGTELSVDVSNFSETEPESRDQIREGEEIRALMSFQQGMRGESDEKQRWALVELQ